MASDFFRYGSMTVRVRGAGVENLQAVKVTGPGADLDLLVPWEGQGSEVLAYEVMEELTQAAKDPDAFLERRRIAAEQAGESDFEMDRMAAFAENVVNFARMMKRHLARALKMDEAYAREDVDIDLEP